MSDVPLTPADTPATATPYRPPVWLRLIPYFTLAILVAWVAFFDRVLAWLEGDLGLGFGWALLVLGLPTLALLVFLALVVLTHEHRRNHRQ